MRIAGDLDGGVFGGRAHGELIHVGLTEDDGACVEEELDAGSREGGAVVGEDAAGAGGAAAVAEGVVGRPEVWAEGEVVFDGDGNTSEGEGIAGSDALIDEGGVAEGGIGEGVEEGIDGGFARGEAIEGRAGGFDCGEGAGVDGVGDGVGGGGKGHALPSPMTLGTLMKGGMVSGARAMSWSLVRVGPGVSGSRRAYSPLMLRRGSTVERSSWFRRVI